MTHEVKPEFKPGDLVRSTSDCPLNRYYCEGAIGKVISTHPFMLDVQWKTGPGSNGCWFIAREKAEPINLSMLG